MPTATCRLLDVTSEPGRTTISFSSQDVELGMQTRLLGSCVANLNPRLTLGRVFIEKYPIHVIMDRSVT